MQGSALHDTAACRNGHALAWRQALHQLYLCSAASRHGVRPDFALHVCHVVPHRFLTSDRSFKPDPSRPALVMRSDTLLLCLSIEEENGFSLQCGLLGPGLKCSRCRSFAAKCSVSVAFTFLARGCLLVSHSAYLEHLPVKDGVLSETVGVGHAVALSLFLDLFTAGPAGLTGWSLREGLSLSVPFG